jgi:replication-associated recombination protein RarA
MQQQLVDKYAPRRIGDFVGLAAPKAMFSRLVADPYQSSWLSLGNPGVGKTAMSFAAAHAMKAAIHHVPARQCDLEEVDRICRMCAGYPMIGERWVVIIDEADVITGPAQLALLSVLDGTAGLKDVVFLMTANSTKLLHDRFLSRVRTLHFNAPSDDEVAEFLQRVFKAERGKGRPDFTAIAAAARGNVRSALMTLETELLVPGSFVPLPPAPIPMVSATTSAAGSSNNHAQPSEITELQQRRSDAAKRAWASSPKLQALRKRA